MLDYVLNFEENFFPQKANKDKNQSNLPPIVFMIYYKPEHEKFYLRGSYKDKAKEYGLPPVIIQIKDNPFVSFNFKIFLGSKRKAFTKNKRMYIYIKAKQRKN